MENKKTNGNDVKAFFLVFILVIVAAVLAYFYLYMPKVEQRKTLERENYDLDVRLINLKNMAVDEDVFKMGINESSKSIKQVMNHYSAGNTPEKSIMMANRMEEEVGLRFPNLTFSQPELLTSVEMPMITDNESGSFDVEYYNVGLMRETLSMNYSCSYEQLKKLVDYINAYPERMNIDSITITYDSENRGLLGSMTLNLFSVTGTGKEYKAPDISGLSMGVGNIFSQ